MTVSQAFTNTQHVHETNEYLLKIIPIYSGYPVF